MSADRPFSSVDAVVFDLDGVLTETTRLHRQAWSRLFNEYLRRREAEAATPFTEDDYRRYVDGKPRYDGVESFLRSRRIDLPDPAAAELPEATRDALETLKPLCAIAIISGRDLDDLRRFVGVPGIFYAGSHGMQIREPDGREHERAHEFLPALDRTERRLHGAIAGIPGAGIERKRFAIAAHYREVPDDHADEVLGAVERVHAEVAGLVIGEGRRERR